MEDRAAAAGSGGGGEGGRDRDREDASRKGLVSPWSQSSEEARAVRSEYANVRAMIHEEVKGDLTLGQFGAALNKIEQLYGKVQRPMEQVADAEALLDLTNALVSSTKLENMDGPTPSAFITALISKYGAGASPLVHSNESFSWTSLGCAVSGLFMPAAGYQTMNGPIGLGLAVKKRRHVVRRQSGHLGSGPAEASSIHASSEVMPDELAPDQDERNDTNDNIVVMFHLLRSHRNVKLERLVLNRQSFAQTAENIFALSFLVKDGRAQISVDDNGNHFVAPRNAPSAGSIALGEVVNSQFVFRFDIKDWQIMKDMVNPGEELMPHWSSYHGGEYKKSAQSFSAPDFCNLASDSEHPEEGRFHNEDSAEFTKEANPGEELMPHRSSYHGGEYKRTAQSFPAPDCGKLASDSEQSEEGRFHKEDPEEEFTKEEAMELDQVKCCSGDGGLKKRKKLHVVRKLF